MISQRFAQATPWTLRSRLLKVVTSVPSSSRAFASAVRDAGVSETFTVRKVSFGIGVERTFPVHSPNLESITISRRGRVRRAKLYYLRDLRGKKARIKERR